MEPRTGETSREGGRPPAARAHSAVRS